jgi:hypothetical protein
LLCFLLDRPSLLVGCILIFIVIIEKKSGFQGFKGDFFLKKLAFLPFFSICLITRSIPCVCQENLLHFAVNWRRDKGEFFENRFRQFTIDAYPMCATGVPCSKLQCNV